MNEKKSKANVGVLVARFQVHELHEMHKALIDTVIKNHAKVLIVLGVSPTLATTSNPLPFQPRKQLILEEYPPSKYPNISIAYIKDINNDESWSVRLDGIIKDECGPSDKVLLYGGRDSFINYYKGKYDTTELESDRSISGTEIRKKIHAAPQSSKEFRAGVIWATAQRYPISYQCVDIAPLEKKDGKVVSVLLARKPDEVKYRFIGGFVDPSDNSLEEAAYRECSEETGVGNMTMGNFQYVGSHRVDDWRYRNESDKIMTTLFTCDKSWGHAKAADDIAEVRWFAIEELKENLFVEEHKPLFTMLAKKLEI